jgi:hypothetical protein
MDLDNQTLQTLQRIAWFSRCGKPVEQDFGLSMRCASDWSTAAEYFSSPHWEDTTLRARNALTRHLSDKAGGAYQQWNEMTVHAREWLKEKAMPLVSAYRLQHNLPPVFCDCVRWDLLSTIMEATYKKWNPPRFFGTLLEVYEAGHFPCGWEGDWPKGQLMIF